MKHFYWTVQLQMALFQNILLNFPIANFKEDKAIDWLLKQKSLLTLAEYRATFCQFIWSFIGTIYSYFFVANYMWIS